MVLDIQKQIFINERTGVSNTTGSSSAKIGVIPLVNPEKLQEESGYTVTNLFESKYKRSREELYASIEGICSANSLSVEEAINIGLLSSISGKSEAELRQVEQSEIDKIVKRLEEAINAIKEDIPEIKTGKERITFHMIKNYRRLLDGEVPKGWLTINSFRNAQRKNGNESLSERLKRTSGNPNLDLQSLSKEELSRVLEKYFYEYFNSLTGSRSSVDLKQLTDFTKLLFNSSPEEYEMFKEAIIYLVQSNRCKGYEAILESFETEAEKINFASNTNEEKIYSWVMSSDIRGELATTEQVTEIYHNVYRYKDKESSIQGRSDLTSYTREFYDKNAEILIKITPELEEKFSLYSYKAELSRKLEDGIELSESEIEVIETPIELTEEEKEVYEVYQKEEIIEASNAGQVVGVTDSEALEETDKVEVLKIINSEIQKIEEYAGDDFYNEVMKQVVEYVENNADSMNISKEEFEEIMNQVTEGEYSKIAQEVISKANEVNSETQEVKENKTIEEKITDKVEDANKEFYSNQPLDSQVTNSFNEAELVTSKNVDNEKAQKIITERDFVEAANSTNSIDEFKQLVQATTSLGIIDKIFCNFGNIRNQAIVKYAEDLYCNLNTKMQEMVLKGINSIEGFNNLLAITSDATIMKLDDQYSSYYTTKLVKEKKEEALEKKPNLDKNYYC